MGINRMKAFEKKIWLSSPTMHEEEQKYIKDAFDANWISTIGENINELEKKICEYMGCDYAVALAAGTAAIHMALKLTGVKQGDKVFCSDLTFAATANPIIYEKCQPVFIDSEYETWNMDPVALERAFEKYPDVMSVQQIREALKNDGYHGGICSTGQHMILFLVLCSQIIKGCAGCT